MVKAKESSEIVPKATDNVVLDDVLDDELDDELEEDLAGDDWENEDSFVQQERAAEVSQIESFLQQTLMVRCERYNANITSLSCLRKKEALPPKIKNSQGPEEENIQNHPCFGCVGPIIVNWPIQDPPVALHEVEERPVIVHPGIEDDFSIARERQIEAYREQYTGNSFTVDVPKPEELPSYHAVFIKTKREEDDFLSEKDDTPIVSIAMPKRPAKAKVEVKPKTEPKKPTKTKAKTKAKSKVEELEIKSVRLAEVVPEPEPAEEVIEEIAVIKTSPKKKVKKTKADTKKKTKVKAKKEVETEAEGAETSEGHEPCVSCGKAYEPPHSKYWRGDICNPCYAKRLRKRKKKGGPTKTKTKAKATSTTDHPPCDSCGKAYEPPHSKYWRGDICNPCYAKRLRKRRQNKEDSVQSNA